jgi:DNA-binding PadR family transcriptional regulator
MGKRIKLTPLANNILKCICKGTRDTDSLAKVLARDRDTITQSINKLLIPEYISVAKEEESTKRKRRQIFSLTDKGKYYLVGFLDLTWDDIFSLDDSKEDIMRFDKLKETLTDVNEFNKFAKYSAQKCIEYDFFDKGVFALKDSRATFEKGIAKGRAETEIGLNTDSNTYFQSLDSNA